MNSIASSLQHFMRAQTNYLTITTDIFQKLSIVTNNQHGRFFQTHQVVFEPFDSLAIQVVGRFIYKM
jgi:hypothetical protein